MTHLIDDTGLLIRKIASELRPAVLDVLGLNAAIEWQAQEFQLRSGIRCLLRLPSEDIPLNQEQVTAVFRIFQEILTNVARHAQATRITVSLRVKANFLILVVKDNGRGITEEEINNSASLGLLGMHERALLLGGELGIQGYEGKGTRVTLRIPVRR